MRSRKVIIGSIAALVVTGLVASAGTSKQPAEVTPSATDTVVSATPSPVTQVETVEPDAGMTSAQRNAIKTAESYLSYSAFSRKGLIDQLVFEGFAKADATFAADSITVDWNDQAYKAAKSYLDTSSFSLSGLIAQLEFDGFTQSQAKYGANKAYK